jgi:hypothetical protein
LKVLMTPEDWLESARADAHRRGLPDLGAALEGLALAAGVLRAADWNDEAAGRPEPDAAAPAAAR